MSHRELRSWVNRVLCSAVADGSGGLKLADSERNKLLHLAKVFEDGLAKSIPFYDWGAVDVDHLRAYFASGRLDSALQPRQLCHL